MSSLFTDKKLGISKKRRYDLPLHKSEGTGFLTLLIALMTFLAMMALCSFFVLGTITHRWSSGLENKLTIEIPAENEQGRLISAEEIQNRAASLAQTLNGLEDIESYEVLNRDDIQALISPWLGESFSDQDIPLPALISIELKPDTEIDYKSLERKLKRTVPTAYLDRHESWLNDLLRITGSLQFSAFLILIIIGLTTVIAVAGAIKSRIALHKKEVELLHLMGAQDAYIMKQFQRHAFLLSLQGGLGGVLFSALVLLLIRWVAPDGEANLVPDFSFSWFHITVFSLLPLLIAAIGSLTARFTVLRALAQMP